MTNDLKTLKDGIAYCREKTRELEAAQDAFTGQYLRLVEITNDMTPMAEMQALMAPPPIKPLHVLTLPPKSRSGQLWATLSEDLPDRLARDAGGILNEARVQLDHLANILARRAGANSDDASWPVLAREDQLTGHAMRNAREKIRLLSEQDREKVLALQPVNCPEVVDLKHLHAGDIFRKHKRPVTLRARATTSAANGLVGSLMADPRPAPLVAKGDRTRISIFRDCTVRFDLIGGLVILEPQDLHGAGVVHLLNNCINAVEFIVDQFDGREEG